MAASLASDMKVYDNYAAGRTNELLAQFGDVFNAASAGTIRLSTKTARGNYNYDSFFANLGATLAARRDNTSVSAQTDTALTQGEHISVKLSRKIKPVATVRDAWLKAFGSMSQAEFSDVLAEQVANIMQLEMANSVLAAVRAALKQQSASYVTEASLGAISTNSLVSSLAAMGDRANRVKAWVMHSKVYYDLVRSQIGGNITNVSDFNIVTATPITLNRPVIVTDSASLIASTNGCAPLCQPAAAETSFSVRCPSCPSCACSTAHSHSVEMRPSASGRRTPSVLASRIVLRCHATA